MLCCVAGCVGCVCLLFCIVLLLYVVCCVFVVVAVLLRFGLGLCCLVGFVCCV